MAGNLTIFKGLPVCEMERAMLPCSSLFAMHLEILEYLAQDMLYYLLPHLLCIKLAAWSGDLFQICAVQKKSLTGRFASHISLLSAISCPIAQEPTRDDEVWALHLGEGWQSPTRSWQEALSACCQLRGLLTACSHHSQCSHQDITTSATTAEKPNAAHSTHTQGPAGKLNDTGEPRRGQSVLLEYLQHRTIPWFLHNPQCM